MPETVKYTIRMPPKLKRRLDAYLSDTGVKSNHFGNRAIEEALERAQARRRRSAEQPAQSA